MAHEQYKEMIAAQSLGALDESEAQALAAHLEGCGECRAEMIEFDVTAAFLAFDAKPLKPSPELRAKILSSVSTPMFERLRRNSEAASAEKVTQMPVAPAPQSRWQAWAAIAASVLFVVSAIGLALLWRENNRRREEIARMTNQAQQTNREMAEQSEALSILTGPGARMASLTGTSMAPTAHATLAYNESGRAILMTKDLPPAPAGKAYQLWFISKGQPLPGKSFQTDPSGAGMMKDQIPDHALNAVFAITLEPEGGVQKPTGQLYMKSGS
jgi:hypothetical protein